MIKKLFLVQAISMLVSMVFQVLCKEASSLPDAQEGIYSLPIVKTVLLMVHYAADWRNVKNG